LSVAYYTLHDTAINLHNARDTLENIIVVYLHRVQIMVAPPGKVALLWTNLSVSYTRSHEITAN